MGADLSQAPTRHTRKAALGPPRTLKLQGPLALRENLLQIACFLFPGALRVGGNTRRVTGRRGRVMGADPSQAPTRHNRKAVLGPPRTLKL